MYAASGQMAFLWVCQSLYNSSVTLNDADTLLVQRSVEYEHFTDTIQTNWIRRFIRNELLRELFSPRNHKKWAHHPLLNFSVHTEVD